MNLYVFGEYAEWGKSWTEFFYVEWICSYTKDMRKNNLMVYWKYEEQICPYAENRRNTQHVEYLANLKPSKKSKIY